MLECVKYAGAAIVAVVVIVLVILIAVIIMRRTRRIRVARGGAEYSFSFPIPTSLEYAIERNARDAPVISLGMSETGGLMEWGGAAEKKTERHWTSFDSWGALAKDSTALREYSADRVNFLNSLDVDWGDVLKKAVPLLGENREYLGVINRLSEAGNPAIIHMEASKTSIEDEPKGMIIASIPSEQVARVAKMPGLIFFHTHPSHPHVKALPSPADLLAAIDDGFHGRYAAHIIICNYGVILYTISHEAMTDIKNTPDPELSLLYFKRDVIASYSSIRSWRKWTLDDFRAMLLRHKLIYAVYPSGKYVSESYWIKYKSHQDAQIDWEKEFSLKYEIENRLKNVKH